MSRTAAFCAARLLQRASSTVFSTGSLAPAAAASQPSAGCSLRAFAAAAAQGGSRMQPLASQLLGAPAAAVARAAAAGGGGGGATGLALAAAAVRQQSRGFARYLQFQPRQSSPWRRMDLDPTKVLWGLIGANVAGWLAWRVWPREVGTGMAHSLPFQLAWRRLQPLCSSGGCCWGAMPALAYAPPRALGWCPACAAPLPLRKRATQPCGLPCHRTARR